MTTDRLMLLAGIAAGILFFAIPTIEVFRRPGFDIKRHAISVLSLGEGGWIMKTVFIVSGILTVLCAVGIFMTVAQREGGFLAPLLIGIFGLGLLISGLFDALAGLGFPAGTPSTRHRLSQRVPSCTAWAS